MHACPCSHRIVPQLLLNNGIRCSQVNARVDAHQFGFDTFDDEYARRRVDEGWVPVTSPQISSKAVDWLEGRADDADPWLLWLHYFDPHIPYVPHDVDEKAEELGR